LKFIIFQTAPNFNSITKITSVIWLII